MRPKIVLTNVSKSFTLYRKQSEKLLDVLSFKKDTNSFSALRDVSFTIYEGESVGIVGLNGSGKSTLCNLLAQIVPPSAGSIEINGETSLVAIAAGLNNQLSGMENIELKCTMQGMKKAEIEKLKPAIIEFADIGKFIDQPVKNYSSGMKSRLGFAISVHMNPDIMIIDEALSVGDDTFYQKCLERMNQFRKEGKTIIFISHSIGQVEAFCDRVLWLSHGTVEHFGESKETLAKYKEFIKWFNGLSEHEKKEYKQKKIEAQHKHVVRVRKRKNNSGKRLGKILFGIQLCLLIAAVAFSAMSMFGSNSLNATQEKEIEAEEKQAVAKPQADTTVTVDQRGIVNVEKASIYSDSSLETKIGNRSFGETVYVNQRVGDAYELTEEEKQYYISVDSIQFFSEESEELSASEEILAQFLPVFPDSVADSYLYFFSLLQQNDGEIRAKIQETAVERSNDSGQAILDYPYYSVHFTLDDDQFSESITIQDIDSSAAEWEELKKKASAVSEDQQSYYFILGKYKILIDLKKAEATFQEIVR